MGILCIYGRSVLCRRCFVCLCLCLYIYIYDVCWVLLMQSQCVIKNTFLFFIRTRSFHSIFLIYSTWLIGFFFLFILSPYILFLFFISFCLGFFFFSHNSLSLGKFKFNLGICVLFVYRFDTIWPITMMESVKKRLCAKM